MYKCDKQEVLPCFAPDVSFRSGVGGLGRKKSMSGECVQPSAQPGVYNKRTVVCLNKGKYLFNQNVRLQCLSGTDIPHLGD